MGVTAGAYTICNLTIAFASHLVTQWITFTFAGICMGIQSSYANIFLFLLWGQEVGPFMQLAWFAFGCGTLVAPVIVAQLLHLNDYVVGDDDDVADTLDTTRQPVLYACYGIVASLWLINCISWLTCCCLYPHTEQHPSRQLLAPMSKGDKVTLDKPNGVEDGKHSLEGQGNQASTKAGGMNALKIIILALHMTCQHMYFGLEVAFGSYLTTFAMKSDQRLSQLTGAKLTSVFWGVFTFMKLPAIVYMQWLGNGTNVMLGLSVSLAGTAVLIVGGDTDYVMLLVGTIIVSAGLSSIFASMMRYLEGYIPVTESIGALSSLFYTLGEFTFPFVIGLFIDDQPLILTYAVLFSVLCMGLLFPIIMLMCRFQLTKS